MKQFPATITVVFAACACSPTRQEPPTFPPPTSVPQHTPASSASTSPVDLVALGPETLEYLARPDGLYSYSLRSGEAHRICDGFSTQPYLADDNHVLFLDDKVNLLNCDLRTGIARMIGSVRLNPERAPPNEAFLVPTTVVGSACVHADDPQLYGWLLFNTNTGAILDGLSKVGEQPYASPPACNPSTSLAYAKFPMVRIATENIPIFARLPSEDGRWAAAEVNPNAPEKTPHETGELDWVLIVDGKTNRVYPLREGPWPPPIDNSKPFLQAVSPTPVSVPFHTRAGTLRTPGFLWIGEYIVQPGVKVTHVNGEIAVSNVATSTTF
jgi:hypothetical protein